MSRTVRAAVIGVVSAVLALSVVGGTLAANEAFADERARSESCRTAIEKADRLVEAFDAWVDAAITDPKSDVQHIDRWQLADRAKLINARRDAWRDARGACVGVPA